MTTVHYISLRIEQEEWLRYYAGEATHLRCMSTSGKVIHLAARHFRPFTTRNGIEGLFKLTLRQNSFVSLVRLG